MSRVMVAAVFAMFVGTIAASAQIARDPSAASPIDQALVGMPIVTVDGETVGYITEVGVDDGQAVVIGEIVRPLGIGYDAVVIPTEMFANKGDHVELTITAEQTRSRLARPEN